MTGQLAEETGSAPDPVAGTLRSPQNPSAQKPSAQNPPPQNRTLQRWLYLGIAVALVAVVLVVWALGGFDARPRRFEEVQPGATISTGPYELVFRSATAERQPATSYRKGSVKVIVSGTGRTTGNETITPSVGPDGMFIAYDKATAKTYDSDSQQFGQGGPSGFTPGLPAIPYQVEFSLPGTYRPGDTISFGVIAQRYRSTALIKTDDAEEKGWHNDDRGYQLVLPLTVLPDAKS